MEPESRVVTADAIAGALAAVRQPADAICDRWTLEIILHLLPEARRFSDLVRLSGMASRLVASRLVLLQTIGVVDRRPYSDTPLRHVYFLTSMGLDLRAVLGRMIQWERRWRPDTVQSTAEIAGLKLDDLPASSDCAFCLEPVTARNVTLRMEPTLLQSPLDKQTIRRRTTVPAATSVEDGNPISQSLTIFGDKWGIEILICAFFGIRRFNDFRSAMGISANILSDRLGRLSNLGILAGARPGSHFQGYWLTEKGVDLYPVTVAVQTWADRWLVGRIRSPVRLIHRPCGREIALRSGNEDSV